MKICDKEKRRLLKAYWREMEKAPERREAWELKVSEYAEARATYLIINGKLPPTKPPERNFVTFPPECLGMVCGAKGRRTGEPCQSTQLFRNGRCKWHGGASTGPKSKVGRDRSLANLLRGSKL